MRWEVAGSTARPGREGPWGAGSRFYGRSPRVPGALLGKSPAPEASPGHWPTRNKSHHWDFSTDRRGKAEGAAEEVAHQK